MAKQPVKKGERMEVYVASLGQEQGKYDKCYLGFFVCFNKQEYYEAHDVLEHLWLQEKNENYYFYKGLIQLAGAFVHLKKQRARPDHPKDGRRLKPATRLFRLAEKNLASYGPHHFGLDILMVINLIQNYEHSIVEKAYLVNPWTPQTAPQLSII